MIYTIKNKKVVSPPWNGYKDFKDLSGAIVKNGDYILVTNLNRFSNLYISKVELVTTDQDPTLEFLVFKSLSGKYLNLQWRQFIICTPEMLQKFKNLIVN